MIIIYCHAKTLGERHAARGRQPRRAGWVGAKERTPESGIILSSYPILKANALETMEILSVICYTNHIIIYSRTSY